MKRLISLILPLVLLISVLSTAAFAESLSLKGNSAAVSNVAWIAKSSALAISAETEAADQKDASIISDKEASKFKKANRPVKRAVLDINANPAEAAEARTSEKKSAIKTMKYTGKSGDVQWEAVLLARFTYDGEYAECENAQLTVTITNTDWYEIGRSVTYGGRTAKAILELGYRFLGVTVNSASYELKITCLPDGTLE